MMMMMMITGQELRPPPAARASRRLKAAKFQPVLPGARAGRQGNPPRPRLPEGLTRRGPAGPEPRGLGRAPQLPPAPLLGRRPQVRHAAPREHRDKQAHKRSSAAAPALTFDLTFVLGYDLFVFFESARGGHYPAVLGLLPRAKFG